jgi:ferredoxin
MAKFDHRQSRWPDNVHGQFYVDKRCLFCGACGDLLPKVFKRDGKGKFMYVGRQPKTVKEVSKAYTALFYCPEGAIHDDGLEFDWDTIPPNDSHEAIKRGPKHGKML